MTTVGDWRLRAIMRRLGKLKGRSIPEVRERAMQALEAELERQRIAPTVGEFADSTLSAALDHTRIPGSGDLTERLHSHFTSRESPPFFAGVRDGSSAAQLRTPRWSGELSRLLSAADAVLNGTFDLLGHRGLSFGSPIDWHLDPVSGKRAPRIHWSRIPYLDAERIGDHKVIWEINRHQHFFILGRAFQANGHPRYAECFVAHLTSWMDENPPKDGVNWASSLEVAYRTIAWLWAMELFRASPVLTKHVVTRVLKYLYIHGRHLERYLSTYFSPNTHLTGEALGLLYLGLLVPEFRRAERWRQLGWRILERELPRQVHSDGVYFEQATYYHRYTVDIYLHALLLAERNGMPVPTAMRNRLSLAADHLADLTRGDGSVPIIGDDDGGSLVLLEEREFANVTSTLATASVILDKPELAAVAGRASEEVLWLLGCDGVRKVDLAVGTAPPSHQSRLFAVGGYAILRDGWDGLAQHAVIDCGPLGALNCGHAHSDALAIEVAVGGCPVFIDPGTYTYTESAADRDLFRHSASHNTVTVDGQSASVPDGPFSWTSRADAHVESWWAGATIDRFVGSHGGFQRLTDPAVHRRSVIFVRGEYWVLLDSILSSGVHEATAHFHTALGARVSHVTPSSSYIDVPCANGRSRLFFAVAGDAETLTWSEEWVSSSYGIRARAPCAHVRTHGQGRRDIVSILCPTPDDTDVSVREISTERAHGHAVVVDRPGRHDLLIFGTGGAVRLTGLEMKADAALIRRKSQHDIVNSVALFGDAASVRTDGLSFQATGAAEFTRTDNGWSIEGNGAVATPEQERQSIASESSAQLRK